MEFSARVTNLEDILPWRDMYRSEMACQIVHESIHERQGWSDEYMLFSGGEPAGYGSVAVAGPWRGAPTAYEFYIAPHQRLHLFELFRAFLEASGAVSIEVQSNAMLATTMLHTFAGPATSESVLFHDSVKTSLRPAGATFRHPVVREVQDLAQAQLRWHGVVEVDGTVAASGGILFHYNRPYGDIHMETAAAFRRRGLGSFLVQELKRVCYEGGHVPAARCHPDNIASRRTLQRAGFVPYGHILKGSVRSDVVRRGDDAG
jgi:GNAT superfamily N-acetyltransferase